MIEHVHADGYQYSGYILGQTQSIVQTLSSEIAYSLCINVCLYVCVRALCVCVYVCMCVRQDSKMVRVPAW